MKNKLELVLLDFDGVLSDSRFYNAINDDDPEIYKKIQLLLFSKEAWPLSAKWMRGQLSYREIHDLIGAGIGVTSNYLNKALEESVKKMKMNDLLLDFTVKMRKKGVKVAVFTDNMDVFDKIFVTQNRLDEIFDGIFSSSMYGKLKLDNNAQFLDQVIELMLSKPENTLLLDDSMKIGDYMLKKGGKFYHYNNYVEGHNDFMKWFNKNFSNYPC